MKGRQFWDSTKTEASRNLLAELAASVDFVLIGGWAVYQYTQAQGSLDIDIAIAHDQLPYFRKHGISQYAGIGIKYSIINDVYVDLFLPGEADMDLPFPVNEILENATKLGGPKVVDKEWLLLLKLWGYFRADEGKHRKDVVDVVTLLMWANIDLKKLQSLIKRYKITRRRGVDAILEYLDVGETAVDYMDISIEDYRKWKKEMKLKLTQLQ